MSNPSEAKCPRCGATLPPSAPEGLCPRCLGALNLATDTVLTGADAIAAQPPLTPAELAPHFPQLEIIECLGRGGMGVVYRVRQKALNRLAALKLLAPERVTDAGFAERFTREAQALARLNHPNIVTIYDFGCTRAGGLQPPSAAQLETQNSKPGIAPAGFYFLLMEFMDGVNLRQAMKASRFTPEQALAIVPPVCEALQYAHEQGIVHRDIKPENLLLDKAGRLKIADFGIAKILGNHGARLWSETQPQHAGEPSPAAAGPADTAALQQTAAGTPGYMAPEQKSAPQRVDSRADIYSLGVVIYEMLTGELPAEKLQPPSRRVQIDVRLDEIVLRALEQRPELRFQTAADLRTQVETFGREEKEERIAGRRERIERGEPPPSLSSTLSPLSAPPRPFLKIGTSTLTTPEQLASAEGQIFCYRTRGQLILDDRQLTHSRAGMNTVIPLAAIRDLSIGQYPRTMNPAGIDLLSVTYEEGGQRKQVLLSPMEGFFGLPSTWNARVAEWFLAIREATTTATGRAPGNTPAERLGVPGSSPLLLAVACVPLLVGAGLLWMLTRRTDSASSFAGGASLLIFAALVIGFLAPALFGWLSGSRRASGPGGSTIGKFSVLLLVLVPLLLFGFLIFRIVPRKMPAHSDVTHFETSPVGVSNNVVLVDVTTESERWSYELRTAFTGPKLERKVEESLIEPFQPPSAGTLVRPTLFAGNYPRHILPGGRRQTTRLGFVLPTDELAQEAFRNLRPIGPLPAIQGRTHAGTLFELRHPDGTEYRAALQVGLPVSASDPDWVSVGGRWQRGETNVTCNWEVLASQPGTARFQREGNLATTTLQLDAKAKFYRAPVHLELSKVSTNRVLLVTRMGGVTTREEQFGDFRELTEELSYASSFGASTVRGVPIELWRWQGKSFTVQVEGAVPAATAQPRVNRLKLGWSAGFGVMALLGLVVVVLLARQMKQRGASLGSVAGVVLAVPFVLFAVFMGGGILLNAMSQAQSAGPVGMAVPVWAIGAVVLPIAAAGIVLLVVLMRIGGAAGKTVKLLVGVPLLCVVAFIVIWVLSRAKSAVSAIRSDQMVLESNYPAPAHPHPPGRVQQTQNGFRLQLPAAQLASFEFFLRQADDAWQPAPSLAAFVATGTNGAYNDTLYWTLRRSGASETTNQLWFWTVSVNANGRRPLPQLTDHGTNFAHHVPHGEALDWWQLAVPATVTLKTGEQQIIPLFRTHGTATVRGGHPKEAFLRVRCEPLTSRLVFAPGFRNELLVEAGLAAHTLLAKVLPAKNPASPPPQQPWAGPLVRRGVKQANPGGKDLVMTFEELRRDGKTSTATVKRVSGASVPSAMFIARGAYDIAQARGAAYFINLKEWDAEDGTRMYLIGFAPDKNVDPQTYFDLKEPLPADKRLLFLSVSAYERVFKDQP